MLAICVHKERVFVWQQNHIDPTVNFDSYLWNRSENNNHYLDYENSGQWALDLNKINPVSLEKILPLLPAEFHRKLAEQAVCQQIFTIWRKQMLITATHYAGNVLTLHTPLGNVFKTIGLSPNWQERDDVHFLGRCWITTQQLLAHQTYSEKLLSLSAGLLEVALLHPHIQSTYAYLTNNRDFSKAKSVIRFIGDLLQLGLYNFSYLARLLEFCFPNNESIWKIGLSIRMVSHFYMLTKDLSYWYLGMALFVLPHLPSLLENLGIPVTRGLHKLSNQLAQMFILQSLLNQFSTDEGREEQLTRELALADERAKKGEKRVKNFLVKSWCGLWKETKPTENPSENNTLQISTNLR